MPYNNVVTLLGASAEDLLTHCCDTIPKAQLSLPSPGVVNEVFLPSNRSTQVLKSLAALFGHGRLAHTGYLSILPVDQGVDVVVQTKIRHPGRKQNDRYIIGRHRRCPDIQPFGVAVGKGRQAILAQVR